MICDGLILFVFMFIVLEGFIRHVWRSTVCVVFVVFDWLVCFVGSD